MSAPQHAVIVDSYAPTQLPADDIVHEVDFTAVKRAGVDAARQNLPQSAEELAGRHRTMTGRIVVKLRDANTIRYLDGEGIDELELGDAA